MLSFEFFLYCLNITKKTQNVLDNLYKIWLWKKI